VGALLGGAGAALAVYALTLSNGKLSAARLVLVGIGMASILSAVNALLMVKASINAAQTAAQWLAGSFNATTWGEVGFALSAILVLVPAALLLARPLSVMITGDDLAIGLGVDVERRRRELMIVGVALTGPNCVRGVGGTAACAAHQPGLRDWDGKCGAHGRSPGGRERYYRPTDFRAHTITCRGGHRPAWWRLPRVVVGPTMAEMRNKDTMTTATTTPALQARHLSVGYGGANIITDLNVSIPTGEFTVIVGPNACGKSTLLRSLARDGAAPGGRHSLYGHEGNSPHHGVASPKPHRPGRHRGLRPDLPGSLPPPGDSGPVDARG